MEKTVESWSRHEHLVLYDPAAIPADMQLDPDLDAQDPVPPSAEAMAQLARTGNALILRIAHEDCQATLRIIIDQQPRPHIAERGRKVIDNVPLRLPSGTLVVSGIEFLCRVGESRPHADSALVRLPAGEYAAHVWNLMPWKCQHGSAEIRSRTTKADRFVNALVNAYTMLGVVLFPGNLIGAPLAVGVAWAWFGLGTALKVLGFIVALDIAVTAGFWFLDIASKRFPILNRQTDIEAAFAKENPDVVVCLQRLATAGKKKSTAMATLELT